MDWSKMGKLLVSKKRRRAERGESEPFDRGEGDEGYRRMQAEYKRRAAKKAKEKEDKEKYGYADGGVKCDKKEKFKKLKELLRSKK